MKRLGLEKSSEDWGDGYYNSELQWGLSMEYGSPPIPWINHYGPDRKEEEMEEEEDVEW